METITQCAHFDGEQIWLDDPYELLPKLTAEQNAWLKLSAQGLSAAFGDEEPEYPLTLIKESRL